MELDRAQFSHFCEIQWDVGRDASHLRSRRTSATADAERRGASPSCRAVHPYGNALMKYLRATLQQQPAPTSLIVHNSTKMLHVKVNAFTGKNDKDITLWFHTLNMGVESTLTTNERLEVTFAVSHLRGRAQN